MATNGNDESGSRPGDRPGWATRFFAWLRDAPLDRRPTLADLITGAFSFLEEQYGFRRGEVVDRSMYTTVTWVTDTSQVRVSVDQREGAEVDVACREPRPGVQGYGLFTIRHFREHGSLAGIRAAAKARRRPRTWSEELEQLASDLQAHAPDILKGDFSLFDALDEECRAQVASRAAR